MIAPDGSSASRFPSFYNRSARKMYQELSGYPGVGAVLRWVSL